MSGSAQTVLVSALFLVPGIGFVGAFNRASGRYRDEGAGGYLLKVIFASAVVLAALAWPLYYLYSRHRDALTYGGPVSRWVAVVPLALIAASVVAGSLVGLAAKRGWRIIRWYEEGKPQPTAWDHMWRRTRDTAVTEGSKAEEMVAVARGQLVTGKWVCGVVDKSHDGFTSKVTGYPEPMQVFMSQEIELDAEGNMKLDSNGDFVTKDNGVLLAYDDLVYLQYLELPAPHRSKPPNQEGDKDV